MSGTGDDAALGESRSSSRPRPSLPPARGPAPPFAPPPAAPPLAPSSRARAHGPGPAPAGATFLRPGLALRQAGGGRRAAAGRVRPAWGSDLGSGAAGTCGRWAGRPEVVAWRAGRARAVGCRPGSGRRWPGLGPGRPAPPAPAAAAMWCLHCHSERTQSLLELELDSG